MSYFQSSSQISDIIADLPSVDGKTQNKAASRQAELTKPPGSLGRLEKWPFGWRAGNGVTAPRLSMVNA